MRNGSPNKLHEQLESLYCTFNRHTPLSPTLRYKSVVTEVDKVAKERRIIIVEDLTKSPRAVYARKMLERKELAKEKKLKGVLGTGLPRLYNNGKTNKRKIVGKQESR